MILRIDQPNAKQEIALCSKRRNIGYGGARGGGKTWLLRTKVKLRCVYYAGYRVLIVRQTYKELLNNHIDPLRKELEGIATYNDSKKRITFKNGSIIDFIYCMRDDHARRVQGVEYDMICFDEAEHLSEFQMSTIAASCRGANDFPKQIIYCFNPGGQGHAHLRRIFIDRAYDPEKEEKPEDYEFVQALITDNLILLEKDPEYIKQLKALPEKIRRAWLDGDWDAFSGQFFEELRLKPDIDACIKAGIDPEDAAKRGLWTHVIPAFRPPDGWKIYRSFDFGYSRPFSVAWWAVDFDGRLYRILELYGCTRTPNEGLKWTPDQIFRRIREIENEHPWLMGKKVEGVADPAIWDASTGISIAETGEKYGIYFEKGDHARVTGWMQCHYRLAFDERGLPMMYVFDNCKAFIRTIPLLVYDEHKVEDLDTDGEDHSRSRRVEIHVYGKAHQAGGARRGYGHLRRPAGAVQGTHGRPKGAWVYVLNLAGRPGRYGRNNYAGIPEKPRRAAEGTGAGAV